MENHPTKNGNRNHNFVEDTPTPYYNRNLNFVEDTPYYNRNLNFVEDTLNVLRYNSIHEIDPVLWDSILSEYDFFHKYAFIKLIEDAKVMNAQFHYLLFYKEDKIIASAALSCFTICLDLFLGKAAHNLFNKIRRLFPGFFKITILFCGLPISIGKPNLIIKDNRYYKKVISLLIKEMKTIGRLSHIRYLCVKEFTTPDISFTNQLINHNFLHVPSLPYGTLAIRWKDFNHYIFSLKHHYRRLIKKSLLKMGHETPIVSAYKKPIHNPENPRIILEKGEVCKADIFFKLYLNVMERAEVKLEILNRQFFEELIKNKPEEFEFITFIHRDRVLGSGIIHTAGKKMTFLLIGLDYQHLHEYDVYFNLVYAIIDLSIKRGCTQLDLGQTSHFVKQRVGGVFTPVCFYLRSENPFVQAFLKMGKNILFPEIKVTGLNVFKR